MAHDHSHSHSHDGHAHDGHSHTGVHVPLSRALVLTAIVAAAEVVGGFITNSLALFADAGHMVTDVAVLGLAILAAWLSRRPAPPKQTFGARRWEVLAAWVNGAALVAISIGIMWEAISRFSDPPPVAGGIMLGIASVGLVTNALSAWWLHGASGDSLNVRAAYLHVMGDLAGSLATIIAAVVLLTLHWRLADPIASVAVSLLVMASAWRLMREATDVLLEATPPHIDLTAVRAALAELPLVESVHDLHVWTVGGGVVAMSAHLVLAESDAGQGVLEASREAMSQKGIAHVTIQVEGPALDGCGDCAPVPQLLRNE
jgi:cobalt-zinc-cadmium efflux system protein